MSINFEERFGQRNNNTNNARGAQNTKTNDDQPTAEYWINIGYAVEPNAEGNYGFVSLPFGIALDTMKEADERVRNLEMAMFRQAQNALLADIVREAESLKPGEDIIIGADNGLQIQIRRRQAEVEAADKSQNHFIRRLSFAGASQDNGEQ